MKKIGIQLLANAEPHSEKSKGDRQTHGRRLKNHAIK